MEINKMMSILNPKRNLNYLVSYNGLRDNGIYPQDLLFANSDLSDNSIFKVYLGFMQMSIIEDGNECDRYGGYLLSVLSTTIIEKPYLALDIINIYGFKNNLFKSKLPNYGDSTFTEYIKDYVIPYIIDNLFYDEYGYIMNGLHDDGEVNYYREIKDVNKKEIYDGLKKMMDELVNRSALMIKCIVDFHDNINTDIDELLDNIVNWLSNSLFELIQNACDDCPEYIEYIEEQLGNIIYVISFSGVPLNTKAPYLEDLIREVLISKYNMGDGTNV